jgi:hypothetical protein
LKWIKKEGGASDLTSRLACDLAPIHHIRSQCRSKQDKSSSRSCDRAGATKTKSILTVKLRLQIQLTKFPSTKPHKIKKAPNALNAISNTLHLKTGAPPWCMGGEISPLALEPGGGTFVPAAYPDPACEACCPLFAGIFELMGGTSLEPTGEINGGISGFCC